MSEFLSNTMNFITGRRETHSILVILELHFKEGYLNNSILLKEAKIKLPEEYTINEIMLLGIRNSELILPLGYVDIEEVLGFAVNSDNYENFTDRRHQVFKKKNNRCNKFKFVLTVKNFGHEILDEIKQMKNEVNNMFKQNMRMLENLYEAFNNKKHDDKNLMTISLKKNDHESSQMPYNANSISQNNSTNQNKNISQISSSKNSMPIPKKVLQNSITRKVLNLNEVFPLGTLYNACSENFLDGNFFPSHAKLPDTTTMSSTIYNNNQITIIKADDIDLYSDLLKYGIESDLQASIISGLKNVENEYVNFLLNQAYNPNEIRMVLLYNFMTKKTSITENGLQFSNENLQKCQHATHILTDIEYGFTAVLILKRFLKPNESKDETKIMLQKLLDDIGNSIKAKENHLKTDQVDCVFELLPIPGIDNRPKTLQDAVDTLIQLNPQSFVDIPFRYTFIPITPYFKKAQVYNKYPEDVNKSIIQAFEKFRKCKNQFEIDGSSFHLPLYLPFIHEEEVQKIRQVQENVEDKMKKEIRAMIPENRCHKAKVGAEFMAKISSITEKYLEEIHKSIDKKNIHIIQRIKQLQDRGVTCIGNKDEIKLELFSECYIYSGNINEIFDTKNWRLFNLKLEDEPNATKIFLNSSDQESKIAYYKNGMLEIEDLLAHCQLQRQNQKCWAKMDSDKTLFESQPTYKVPLQLICPNAVNGLCGKELHEWFCKSCKQKIMLGLDEYFHCNCGISSPFSYEFNCNDWEHGEENFCHFANQLEYKNLLNQITLPPVYNILIVGQTHVGKSTLINSFANYFSLNSAREALISQPKVVIPCKYIIQTDNTRRTLEIGDCSNLPNIQIGEPVTQETMTYTFQLGDKFIRLIDTPSITIRENFKFEEILQYVLKYKQLHAICFLFKPNETKRTIPFEYCINVILSKLDPGAYKNIIFGFTHSISTRFQPGETIDLLKDFFYEHEKDINTNNEVTFYMENETFRYLWAKHESISLPHYSEQDFEVSWNHSKSAITKMLDYIMRLEPMSIDEMFKLNNDYNNTPIQNRNEIFINLNNF